jgi:hypothetical protein
MWTFWAFCCLHVSHITWPISYFTELWYYFSLLPCYIITRRGAILWSILSSSHRGERLEIVSWFIEGLVVGIWSIWMTRATTNTGCFGWGRDIDSFPKWSRTDEIVGLSAGSSCTHKSLICMHFKTSVARHDSINKGSTNSSSFPSFHSVHACQYKFKVKIQYTLRSTSSANGGWVHELKPI